MATNAKQCCSYMCAKSEKVVPKRGGLGQAKATPGVKQHQRPFLKRLAHAWTAKLTCPPICGHPCWVHSLQAHIVRLLAEKSTALPTAAACHIQQSEPQATTR